MKIKSLTFISGNSHKAKLLSDHLNFPIKHQKVDLDEIQSTDPEEVVRAKVQAAYELVKSPVLVEDTSLSFNALGRLPGPFIKWFLKEFNQKYNSLDGICRILDSFDTRQSLAEILFAIFDGSELKIFSGIKKGAISDHPKGNFGVGWDPIFIPDGSNLTYGEFDWDNMTQEELLKWSARIPVIKEIEKYLNE